MAEKLIVTCRPARQSDTQGVIELTQNIWEGHDYVPQVWEEWLADEHGLLAVAEHEDRLVGLGKLTRVSDADWWLEGLRTHPGLEGRGVASQMHAYLLERWLQTGAGTLRLATASFRVAVHRLCQRTGFDKVAELTFFKAPATQADADSTEVLGKTFRSLKPGEAGQALAFASQSPLLTYTSGLMDQGWRWAPPLRAHFDAAIEEGRAFWWRAGRGLVITTEDSDDEGTKQLFLQLAAASLPDLAGCLEDSRRLAGALGYAKIGWSAPSHPDLLTALEQAGFQRDWDASLYIFARKHPLEGQL